MRRLFVALSLLLVLAVGVSAQTSPPPALMSFQGRLTKPDGTPVSNGNYQITFSLWSALSGGTKRWEQVSNTVPVRNGAFSVILDVSTGFQNGITGPTLFDPTMWLEIKLGSNAALTPRQPLTSVAYALKAATVPDGSLTASKFVGGVVSPSGAAGGDLTGFYPNPQIKTDASLLYKVSGTLMTATGAGVAVDAQQTTTGNEVNDSAWQSFTPTTTSLLTGLDIYVGTTTGLSKTIPVVLYSGEGTSGTELARRTTTFSTNFTFQHVDFNPPVSVTAGQKYTWFIGTSSSLKFAYATLNPYAGGRADVGASLDYAFRTYQTTPANGTINVSGDMVLGSAVANLAGLQIGGNTSRYVNIGQSGSNNLLLGWIYNATPANAYGLLETFGGANPLALQTAGGRVGVGITNPGAKLEVRAAGVADGIRVSATGTNAPMFGLFENTTERGALGLALAGGQYSTSAVSGDAVLRATTGNLLLQSGGGAAGIYVDKSNNVGIGTVPSRKLDVNGAVGLRGTNTLEFGAGVAGKEASAGKIGYQTFTADALDIVGAGTTATNRKIKFWNEGGAEFNSSVTIGTTLPLHGLEVRSKVFSLSNPDARTLRLTDGITNLDGFFLDAGIGNPIPFFGTTTLSDFVLSAGFNQNLWLTSDGRVGVNGGPIANYKLYVNGQAGGTTGWVQSSDARYKQHIATFDNALETILALRGVTFDWRQNDFPEMKFEEGHQIGFIAQEVEKVLPELVKTSANGYKAVAYSNVVPVLVEAVKTLNAKVETLKKVEAENAELKAKLNRVDVLEAQLTALATELARLKSAQTNPR